MCKAEEKPSIDTIKNTLQWLHHCIEVETKAEHCGQSLEVHQAALDCIVADPKNNIPSGKEVAIHVTTVPQDSPFDFDSVHHLPLPALVEEYPLVLEAVYQEDSSKYFVRVKTDLNAFDGVTALHSGLNLIEYLESKDPASLSPYPFTKSNPSPPEQLQFANFEKHLKRVGDAKAQLVQQEEQKREAPRNKISQWARTPAMHDFEELLEERPGLRFTDVKLRFHEIMQRIDQAKELWKIPYYAITINYSPSTALSICPTLEDVMDRDRKINHIALPPAGTGPPAPMNAQHVEMLFNTIFLNSYGKHHAPRTQHAKVVGYTWDWSGFLKTFPPFFHIVQIQDSMFFSVSAPTPDMELLKESNVFDESSMGPSQPFKGRPFYHKNAA